MYQENRPVKHNICINNENSIQTELSKKTTVKHQICINKENSMHTELSKKTSLFLEQEKNDEDRTVKYQI